MTKLVSGCDNSKAARKFIHELAQSIRQKLTEKLGNCFFSILTDGSQPRKTGQEKEMVMVRVTDDGLPKFFVVGLIDLDKYGNATADHLKEAIDDLFINQLQLTEDVCTHQLISATTDGASVNTGRKNGLLMQLQRGRDWLVTVHCISHRLELALKDCLLKEKSFKEMKDLMVVLYYQFKRSGKLKRQFKELAKALNATVYAFPKVHGTRFINHVRKGLMNLMNNWPVLKECLENAIESGDFKGTQAKLQGILKKLKNFRFLACCAAIKSLLDQIAPLSLAFEQGDIQFFDLPCLIECTMNSIDSVLPKSCPDFLENCHITVVDDLLKRKLPVAGDRRKKEENQASCTIEIPMHSMTYVEGAADKVISMMPPMIESVKNCIKARFQLNETMEDLFRAMTWLDPANWCDTDEEVRMMNLLYERFRVPLQKAGFSAGPLKSEWAKLKSTASYFYKNCKCRQLWGNILAHIYI